VYTQVDHKAKVGAATDGGGKDRNSSINKKHNTSVNKKHNTSVNKTLNKSLKNNNKQVTPIKIKNLDIPFY
jgi:hypothetical protein